MQVLISHFVGLIAQQNWLEVVSLPHIRAAAKAGLSTKRETPLVRILAPWKYHSRIHVWEFANVCHASTAGACLAGRRRKAPNGSASRGQALERARPYAFGS